MVFFLSFSQTEISLCFDITSMSHDIIFIIIYDRPHRNKCETTSRKRVKKIDDDKKKKKNVKTNVYIFGKKKRRYL